MGTAKPDPRPGLLALDLGTHRVRALALVAHGTNLAVCGRAEARAIAARDGVLVHLDRARAEIGHVLREAALQAGLRAKRVVAGIGGTHLRLVHGHGSLSFPQPVSLRRTHLERALDAAAAIGVPNDLEVLHVLPTGYEVDGARTERPPLGIRARRLAAQAAVVTVSRLALDNLDRVLIDLGYELVDAAAEPLLAASAVLSPEDREDGAVLVDIGAERTSAVAYRHRVLCGLVCLGAGAAHVTRDLGYALRLGFEPAEALKRRFGVASVAAADPEAEMRVERDGTPIRLSQRAMAAVIEPRMREILSLVHDALRAEGGLALANRVVLCGGGANLPGLVELAEEVFASPARLGAVPHPGAPDDSSTALGLVQHAVRCGLYPRSRWRMWDRAVHRLRGALRASRQSGMPRPAVAPATVAAKAPWIPGPP